MAAKQRVPSNRLIFQRSQIICANEVFPESAIADPISDLEIWEEWRNGTRSFPYPGKYSRLGLPEQPSKVSSNSSMGVVGEIFTGLLAQAVVSPWVLVRPIRRWPDFIYYTFDGRYAFVESKAFMKKVSDEDPLRRVPPKTASDAMVDAIQQLNADPFVRVWYAFTEVDQITPLVLHVTFLELDAPNRRREGIETRGIPQAVVVGLADQAINLAAAEIFETKDEVDLAGSEIFDNQLEDSAPKDVKVGKTFKARLSHIAETKLEEVLLHAAPESLFTMARREIQKEVVQRVSKLKKFPRGVAGQRFIDAKRIAVEGKLARVRSIGDTGVFLADMPSEQRTEFGDSWKSNWEEATHSWREHNGIELWRCSTAVLALGDKLDGLAVDNG